MLYIVKTVLYCAIAVVWGVAGMGITTPFYWLSLLLLLGVDLFVGRNCEKRKGQK